MDSISLSLKTNTRWSAHFSKLVIKNTLKLSSKIAVPAQEESTVVLLSKEVKKLLEEQKEAEKKEAEKKKIQETVDKLRENSAASQEAASKEIENNHRTRIKKQIGEVSRRLEALVEIMRKFFLFNDKRGAAVVAKEAAQLAKQLKALIAELKAIGGSSGGLKNVSVPNVDLSDEPEESGAPVEGAENTNGEEMSAEVEAAAQKQAQAQAVQNDAGEIEEAGESKEGEQSKQSEKPEEVKEENKANQAANELQAMAKKLVEEQESGLDDDPEAKQMIRGCIAMLKQILSLAKQTLKQKTGALNNESEEPHMKSNLQLEGARAEKDLEKAIEDLEKAIEDLEEAA